MRGEADIDKFYKNNNLENYKDDIGKIKKNNQNL